MNALDTNVFVYAVDDTDPVKQAIAQELIGRLVQPPSETLLPWQVAGEFLSCLRKWQSAGRISAADVESHFSDVLSMFPLHTPTAKVFETSFKLHGRFSLSHWDCILLAACNEAGVTLLYSEDMDAGTDFDGLTIVNPFT